jgi:hypothetical protein
MGGADNKVTFGKIDTQLSVVELNCATYKDGDIGPRPKTLVRYQLRPINSLRKNTGNSTKPAMAAGQPR